MRRSYSIASAPDGSPRFEIAVTRVQGGPGSTRLHALEPGAVLRFVGPQGFFTRPPAASELPALMIATGTGVTPMRSMLRAAAAQRRAVDRLAPPRRAPRGGHPLRRGVSRAGPRAPVLPLRADALAAPRRRGEGGAATSRRTCASSGASSRRAARERPHAYVCGLERMVGLGARAPAQGDGPAAPAGAQRAVRLTARSPTSSLRRRGSSGTRSRRTGTPARGRCWSSGTSACCRRSSRTSSSR